MIIALFGAPRSGKTTATQLLASHGFRFLSIGQEIKEIAHRLVGRSFTDEEKDTPSPYLGGKTPRDLYIYVGTMDDVFDPVMFARLMMRNQLEPRYDMFHSFDWIIESAGKQAQWDWLVTGYSKGFHSVDAKWGLIEITTTNSDYTDGRHRISFDGPMVHIHNCTKSKASYEVQLLSAVKTLRSVSK